MGRGKKQLPEEEKRQDRIQGKGITEEGERKKDRKLDCGGDSVDRLLPPESGLKLLPALNEYLVPLLNAHFLLFSSFQ